MESAMRPIVLLVLFLAACGPPPNPLPAMRIQRDGIFSDRIRRNAECAATAVAFASIPEGSEFVRICLEGNKAMEEAEKPILEDLDRRIAELSR